ncbi:MAG: hypothetical protein ACPGYP_08205 [Solirubrobacterales bacterium]
MPTSLGTIEGARVIEGVASAQLSKFATGEVVAAAWDDCVEAFEAGDSAERCELRVLQLAELTAMRGLDWPEVSNAIVGAIRDDVFGMLSAGLIDEPDGEIDQDTRSGLDLEERLKLALEYLLRDPKVGQLIAWVGFSNAQVPVPCVRFGPGTAYSSTTWRESYIDDLRRINEARGGDWATDFEGRARFLLLSEPDVPYVLLRIELGECSTSGAVEHARRTARDIVRAAQPGSEWRMMRGAGLLMLGPEGGSAGTMLQEETNTKLGRYSPEFEPTGSKLGALDPAVAARLVAGEENLHRAIRDLDWLERVTALDDDAQFVALGMRLLERLLPVPEDSSLSATISRYLRSSWVSSKIYGDLDDVAHNIVGVLENPMPILGMATPWRARLLPPGDTVSYSIDRLATLQSLDEAAEQMKKDTIQRATVVELMERTESAESLVSWRRTLSKEFEVLLSRAVRQRNALLHGADAAPKSIESVLAFVGWLQSCVAHAAFDAAVRQESLAANLERTRWRQTERELRADTGATVAEILFDADSES